MDIEESAFTTSQSAHDELLAIHTILMCPAECPEEKESDTLTIRLLKGLIQNWRSYQEPIGVEALGAQRAVARLLKYIGPHERNPQHIARTYEELKTGSYGDTWEEIDELYTTPRLPLHAPLESIGKMLTWHMDIAVSNGANAISMPDDYVAIAAWLCGIAPDVQTPTSYTQLVWPGFHAAWTQCVGKEGYDKAAWKSVSHQMTKSIDSWAGQKVESAVTEPKTADQSHGSLHKTPVAWYRTVNGVKAGITWGRENPDIEGWAEFPLFDGPSRSGWLEAAIAWEVCASIHEKYAKGKDALYTTRHKDFIHHAKQAREQAVQELS